MATYRRYRTRSNSAAVDGSPEDGPFKNSLPRPRSIFFDGAWIFRGTKEHFAKALSTITKIETPVLSDSSVLNEIAVARRMSWAASRQTTRPEDMAYCLLGIFNVSMPMLYGEGGRKAFARLQEEIAKESNDLSLLAWMSPASVPDASPNQKYHGVLANSPADFAHAHDIYVVDDLSFGEEFAMTNKGLRISTQLRVDWDRAQTWALPLNCVRQSDSKAMTLGIFLRKSGASFFVRSNPHMLAECDVWDKTVEGVVYLAKHLSARQAAAVETIHREAICFGPGIQSDYFELTSASPRDLWDDEQKMFLTKGMSRFHGCLRFSTNQSFINSPFAGSFAIGCGLIPSLDDNGRRQAVVAIADESSDPGMFTLLTVGTSWQGLHEAIPTIMKDQIVLHNKQSKRTGYARVKLTESMMDGERVFHVDLDIERWRDHA